MLSIALFILLSLFATVADAATITRPAKSFGGTSFINGVIPQASDFNGDVDTVFAEFNGNIDNSNIKSSAAIAASKVNPDGFVTNVRTINTLPCTILEESDQSADAKRWVMCVTGGVLQLSTTTDAAAVQNTWFSIARATGGITMGGTGGTNTINGATTFNQAVTFIGATSLTPSGMVTLYMGTSAPAGWLLMDGGSNDCTGASSANANLCTQLVSLFASANYKGAASTTITVDASSNEILHTGHGKSENDRVHFSSVTTLPAPLSAATVYCIISVTLDRYKISTTCGGSEVDITDTGTGTHSDYFNFVTPDARGRSPLGTGSGAGLTARVIGASGGEETHLLTGAESGTSVHTHGVTDPGHNHSTSITNSFATGSNHTLTDSGGSGSTAFTSNTKTTGLTVNNSSAANASGAHNVLDPFLVMTYIIKL